jgi:hypothetical protein
MRLSKTERLETYGGSWLSICIAIRDFLRTLYSVKQKSRKAEAV